MEEEQMILEWKKQYGYVYHTEINGNEFVYRLLGSIEYQTLEASAEDVTELDEMICRSCVLYPQIEDWTGELYAGYTSTVGRLIREESMITPKEDGSSDIMYVIEQKSNELANRFILQMPLIIKRSFPEYSLKELEAMSLTQQVDLYVKSTWMLKEFEGIELTINGPE